MGKKINFLRRVKSFTKEFRNDLKEFKAHVSKF